MKRMNLRGWSSFLAGCAMMLIAAAGVAKDPPQKTDTAASKPDTPVRIVAALVEELKALETKFPELAGFEKRHPDLQSPLEVRYSQGERSYAEMRGTRPSDLEPQGIDLHFLVLGVDNPVWTVCGRDQLIGLKHLGLDLYSDYTLSEKPTPGLEKKLDEIFARYRKTLRKLDEDIGQQQFGRALRDRSTATPFVLVKVVDGRDGTSREVCVDNSQLLRAIGEEYAISDEKKRINRALSQKDRVFRFAKEKALAAVRPAYSDEMLTEARNLLVSKSEADISRMAQDQQSELYRLCKSRENMFSAYFHAIGHVLLERGMPCGSSCKPGLLYIEKRPAFKGF